MPKIALPKDIDALIVANPYNILYLSGFKGFSDTEREAILIVSNKSIGSIKGNKSSSKGLKSNKSVKGAKLTLITARLYQAEANKLKSRDLDVKIASERDKIQKFTFETLKNSQCIGFEKENLTVAEFDRYKNLLPGRDFIATENLIENLREIKTADEIAKIEKAQVISQKALESLLPTIKAGQTELEIKYRLESIMRDLGAQDTAFEAIVASGQNSGIPHHATSQRPIANGESLLFDFGAKYQNYCADLSRTIFVGKPKDEQVNIYNHVASAQKAAIEQIAHGIKRHEPYHTANNHFKENKLESYFLHSLGHGIGLEVHEQPYLRNQSPATSNQELLNGMVFSIEPGLYFPWGGVRIEDLVVIRNGEPKILGRSQKEIIII